MKFRFFFMIIWVMILFCFCDNREKASSNITESSEFAKIKGDTISVRDIITGKLVLYEYFSDIKNLNSFTIRQIDESYNVVDSFTCSDLLMIPDIELAGDRFIQCKIPFRAGMGVYLERTILLACVNNKTTISLDIISHYEINIGDENEQYIATIASQDSIIYLTENFSSKNDHKSKGEKNFKLIFQKDKGVFYSDMATTDKQVEVISIHLYYYSYVFKDNKWSVIEK